MRIYDSISELEDEFFACKMMSHSAFGALQSVGVASQSGHHGNFSGLPANQGLVIAPMKLNFYKQLFEQLKDDGLVEEGRQLAQRLGLQKYLDANPSSTNEVVSKESRDVLFNLFEQQMSALSQNENSIVDVSRKDWKSVKCRPFPPVAPQEDILDLREIDEEEQDLGDSQDVNMDIGDYLTEMRSRPIPQVKLKYNTLHKQGCSTVCFSSDGRLCASGSVDTSIKVMETSKMRMHSVVTSEVASLRPLGQQSDELRPVIRTFYDHVASVSSLAFHPRLPILFSGSVDKTFKVYDLSRPTQNKKAQSSVTDVSPVNVVSCHPSGDFLYVGTQHPVVRLYDLTTMQCYSSYHHTSQHMDAVLDIKPSADGSVFASCSSDGSVLLWDSVNQRVVNRLTRAHNGKPVFGVQWSRNQRYLLTSGGDHRARLWDLRNGKSLQVYAGPSTSPYCDHMCAVFAAQEKYVLMASTETSESDLCVIDSKSGSVLVKKISSHEKAVRSLVSNPSDKTFLTASDDNKIRFFDIESNPHYDESAVANQ